MATIIVKKHAQQMLDWQKEAKRVYGPGYDSKVAPFISLLRSFCHKQKVTATEGAIGLIDFLRSRGKTSRHYRAVLFSAAVELIEMRDEVAG